jgi:hypothetical protein
MSIESSATATTDEAGGISQARATTGGAKPTEPGNGEPMSRGWTRFFGGYHLFLALLLIYLLVKVWPPAIPPKDELRNTQFLWGFLSFNVSSEAQMILVVILTGALGSCVHAATSFVNFTGARSIVASWRWWYVLRPFIGSTLALGFFFVVRAGFFAPSAGTTNFNLVGFAAMAFLVGMFARQATAKPAELFDTLFRVRSEAEHQYAPQTDKLNR